MSVFQRQLYDTLRLGLILVNYYPLFFNSLKLILWPLSHIHVHEKSIRYMACWQALGSVKRSNWDVERATHFNDHSAIYGSIFNIVYTIISKDHSKLNWAISQCIPSSHFSKVFVDVATRSKKILEFVYINFVVFSSSYTCVFCKFGEWSSYDVLSITERHHFIPSMNALKKGCLITCCLTIIMSQELKLAY